MVTLDSARAALLRALGPLVDTAPPVAAAVDAKAAEVLAAANASERPAAFLWVAARNWARDQHRAAVAADARAEVAAAAVALTAEREAALAEVRDAVSAYLATHPGRPAVARSAEVLLALAEGLCLRDIAAERWPGVAEAALWKGKERLLRDLIAAGVSDSARRLVLDRKLHGQSLDALGVRHKKRWARLKRAERYAVTGEGPRSPTHAKELL